MNGRKTVCSINIQGNKNYSGLSFPKPLEISTYAYEVLCEYYTNLVNENKFTLNTTTENCITTNVFTAITPDNKDTTENNAKIILSRDTNSITYEEYIDKYIPNKTGPAWKKPLRHSVKSLYIIIENMKFEPNEICLITPAYNYLMQYFDKLLKKGQIDSNQYNDKTDTGIYDEVWFSDFDTTHKKYSIGIFLRINTAKTGYAIPQSNYLT